MYALLVYLSLWAYGDAVERTASPIYVERVVASRDLLSAMPWAWPACEWASRCHPNGETRRRCAEQAEGWCCRWGLR